MHTCIHPYVHTYMHPSIHTYIWIYQPVGWTSLGPHINIHKYIPTYLHTYIHTSIHPSIHPYMDFSTCGLDIVGITEKHTYIHTYIHAYLDFLTRGWHVCFFAVMCFSTCWSVRMFFLTHPSSGRTRHLQYGREVKAHRALTSFAVSVQPYSSAYVSSNMQ